MWVSTTFSPVRGRPADKPASPGVSKGSRLTETIHIDAGVDKSLLGAFHAGEIEKSIKHGHVTPARTPTDRPTAAPRRGWRTTRRRHHDGLIAFRGSVRRMRRTKGRMTSLNDGDVTSSCWVCLFLSWFFCVFVRALSPGCRSCGCHRRYRCNRSPVRMHR